MLGHLQGSRGTHKWSIEPVKLLVSPFRHPTWPALGGISVELALALETLSCLDGAKL